MKIVISSTGEDKGCQVDSRFGRAAKFLLYNSDTDGYEIHENAQNLNAVQGAGIQAAQTVAGLDADAVITGHCGPKAFRVLQASGIKIYLGSGLTVCDAVTKLRAGELEEAQSADVEGHWV